MVKNLLLLFVFLTHFGFIHAQNSSKNEVVLFIAPNAKEIKFSFNLTQKQATLSCDFGENEDKATVSQEENKEITPFTYTFKNVTNEERTITLQADVLKTLRISNSKAVTGVKEIKSNVLQTLNLDFTSLTSHSTLDVSQCSALQVLTLVSSGITHLQLPDSKVFKELQASPDILGQGFLTALDLSKVPNLEVLSITGYQFSTLDLSNNKKLVKLQAYLPKTRLHSIIGAKDLKLLQELNVSGNALTFDQIPDMVADGTTVDNFKYGNQATFSIPSANINGYTIDLSNLLFQKGISKSRERTTYEWLYKRNESDTWKTVPADKVSELAGVFTFSPELSDDDIIRLYVRISNDGFPGIGTRGRHYLASYITRLQNSSTGISTIAQQSLEITHLSNGFFVYTPTPQHATLYTLQGKQIWQGTLPANISTPQGIYILKLSNNSIIKIKH